VTVITTLAVAACLVAAVAVAATPAPAPEPVATPTPASPTPPFRAPVTTATYTLNVDKTGATDVTAAINAFVASVPDGSIISFPFGTYKISGAISFNGRHNLVFEGNGSTLNNVGDAVARGADDSFFDEWSGSASHVAIRHFVAIADNPYPGYIGPPPATESNSQFAGFLMMWGGQYIEASNVTMSGIYGDMATMSDNTQYVWIHDNHATDLGRNGVGIVWASHVMVERNAFDVTYGSSLDIEPEALSAGHTITDITFRNNTSGTINYNTPFLFSANGNATTQITNVTVTGNRVTDGTIQSIMNVAASPRHSNLVFTNNVGALGAPKGYQHAILDFEHIDGVTVTGNVQPIQSGAVLATIADCTGVTYP